MNYIEFLKTKIELAVDSGFEIDKAKINKAYESPVADRRTRLLEIIRGPAGQQGRAERTSGREFATGIPTVQ